MRATKHNSRGVKGSSQGFSAKHNDREFNYQKEKHIKNDQVQNNIYWNWTLGLDREYTHKKKEISFDKVEERYYARFNHQWESQCKRNDKAGHSERNKTFDEWRHNKRYCPEEVFMQVGKHEEHIDKELTCKIMREYIAFEIDFAKKHNNCCQILDYAFHFDEDVPQIHYRRVWQYKDASGRWNIGQNKALEKSDLELPEPDEPISKTNNYKITYDRIMRDKFLEICEKNGVQVTREPDKDAKHDMSKDDMLREKKRLAEIDYNNTSQKLSEAQESLKTVKEDINTFEDKKKGLKDEIERLKAEKDEKQGLKDEIESLKAEKEAMLQDKAMFKRYQEYKAMMASKAAEQYRKRMQSADELVNGMDDTESNKQYN